MAKAVLTFSETSGYDDQPEVRYHFPSTYLNQVKAAVGDLVVYYEPRRTAGINSSGGRQAYFAVARLDAVKPDPYQSDHHYGIVSEYLEFDRPVPFKKGTTYFERDLQKSDGSTNKGAFGRSVRLLSDAEFEEILSEGFRRRLQPWERAELGVAEEAYPWPNHPLAAQVVARPFRDLAFQRHVREAYGNACAFTGLRLINGGGRPEVHAAHIRPVSKNGPDSVRNGLALTGTVRWLFERGLVSLSDDYRIVLASQGVPEDVVRLIKPGRPIALPNRPELRPHREYLEWHRTKVFKHA